MTSNHVFPERMISKEIQAVSFFYLGEEDSVSTIRFLAPARHLGLRVIKGVQSGEVFPEFVSQGDVVVIQRDLPGRLADYEHILDLAHAQGKPVIMELDDLLTEMPDDHPLRLNHYYSRALLPMLQAFTQVDLVTVTTAGLRDYVLPYNPNVVILPNYLDDAIWHLRPPLQPARAGDRLVIGYMGGPTHGPDLEMIGPVLADLLDMYPGRLALHFWGIKPPSAVEDRPEACWFPVESHTYLDFADFFQAQSADLFIAPLCDNFFNSCKSHIKFLEYAALGAPGIFSRMAPYQEVVTDGVTGLLASSLPEWKQGLIRLIEDPQLRSALAMNAQEAVRANWLLSKNAYRWSAAYRMAQQRVTTGVHPYSALTRSLRSVARETDDTVESILEGHQREVAELRQQIGELCAREQALTSTRAWRAAVLLQRLRAWLVPHDSTRSRILWWLYSHSILPLAHRRASRAADRAATNS